MLFRHSPRIAVLLLHLLFYAAFAGLRSLILPLPVVSTCLFGAVLIWVSVVDVEKMEIPDAASLGLLLTGSVFVFVDGLDIASHVFASLFWSAVFWAIGNGYARLRGWDGLGFGDVKLTAGLGLWLGFTDTTLVIFAAALAGTLTIVISTVVQRRSFTDIGTTAVAFGPFLCFSAWIIWLF